jgi:putative glutamine amidotransferase
VYAEMAYVEAVARSGGLPVLVCPAGSGRSEILARETIAMLDGLLLTGGGDARRFDGRDVPSLADQQPARHKYETLLVTEAAGRGIPVLGICRGHQTIAEVLGGRVATIDSAGHRNPQPPFETRHGIRVEPRSWLGAACGAEPWVVPSIHRQVVVAPPVGFRVSAVGPDEAIEAIESVGGDFLLGVQFHPEIVFPDDDRAKRLFRAFVDECSTRAGRSRGAPRGPRWRRAVEGLQCPDPGSTER